MRKHYKELKALRMRPKPDYARPFLAAPAFGEPQPFRSDTTVDSNFGTPTPYTKSYLKGPTTENKDPVDSGTELQQAYKNQESCILFNKIPGELRMQIYRNLLISSEVITPDRQLLAKREKSYNKSASKTSNRGRYKAAAGLDGAVLRTCRAVYLEALGILYGDNIFHFNNAEDQLSFRSVGLTLINRDGHGKSQL